MKKNVLKKGLAAFLVGVSAFLSPCNGFADTPSAADDCARELLLSYFPAPIVSETLKKFNVPQEKWDQITQSLAGKDKEVVKMVEEKAATMNPNPLKDPQQRQAAVKLFRDTLLQVFSDAMKENGFADADKYQAMLDDIQQQKAKMFAMCMERHKQKAQKDDINDGADSNDSDDDQDDDVDEEHDDDDDMDEEDEAPSSKSNNASKMTK